MVSRATKLRKDDLRSAVSNIQYHTYVPLKVPIAGNMCNCIISIELLLVYYMQKLRLIRFIFGRLGYTSPGIIRRGSVLTGREAFASTFMALLISVMRPLFEATKPGVRLFYSDAMANHR